MADRIRERVFRFSKGPAFVRRFTGKIRTVRRGRLSGFSGVGIPLPVFEGIGRGPVQSFVEVEGFLEVGRRLPR